eukprot:gnl/TRDRNA2_/TRDRNA2_90476_c0_seq1.p1 gnl/TRDRNA2_/TRDRNA2_90476_c0~~gnl/TRDRNA2_/TRDRNA2_90476_c0_seq1.p1  ORF type:complete len:211 (+),score=48.91 gnl/TRDRNA2_/TRDRNA2_90476_c0_seq1:1-633(+)
MRSMRSARYAIPTADTAEENAAPALEPLAAPPVVVRRAAILAAAGAAMAPCSQNARADEDCVDEMAMRSRGPAGAISLPAPLSPAEEQRQKQGLLQQKKIKDALSEKRAPPVFSSSSAKALSLAKHLKSIGATMYGAYWCSHCYNQKKILGKEAMSIVEYVECDPSSKGNKSKFCEDKKLDGYPTWEINGQLYGGEQSLAQLAMVSEFPG